MTLQVSEDDLEEEEMMCLLSDDVHHLQAPGDHDLLDDKYLTCFPASIIQTHPDLEWTPNTYKLIPVEGKDGVRVTIAPDVINGPLVTIHATGTSLVCPFSELPGSRW